MFARVVLILANTSALSDEIATASIAVTLMAFTIGRTSFS